MQFSKIAPSGIWIGITGIVLFSAKAVMVKLAYQYQVNPVHLLLFRMLFALPFYILILFYIKPQQPDKIKKSDYLWLLFFGLIGYYLASYFDFLGLQYIKAGLERIILFIYPTLVILISKLFFKTRITTRQLLAIIITYFGVVVTFWSEVIPVDGGNENSKIILGGIFIFLSALAYASYLVGSGWLIPKFGAMAFTSYAMIVSCICVIIHYILLDRGDIFSYAKEVYLLGFLMALVSTLIPSFLVSLAIKKLGAPNFSILGSIGPISTIALAYIFLNERLSAIQLVGALIVIAGIRIAIYKKASTEQ